MNEDYYKKMMSDLGMPDNTRLYQALKQVAQDTEKEIREERQRIDDILENKVIDMSITVAAETLRDEVALFGSNQLRYVGGKIEVPVGYWAWRRLRQLATRWDMKQTVRENTRKK